MSEFQSMVRAELISARAKYGKHNSQHEAYAVILEEVEEFWEEVRRKVQIREAMRMELVQIAAMAQRAAEDLGLTAPEMFS